MKILRFVKNILKRIGELLMGLLVTAGVLGLATTVVWLLGASLRYVFGDFLLSQRIDGSTIHTTPFADNCLYGMVFVYLTVLFGILIYCAVNLYKMIKDCWNDVK